MQKIPQPPKMQIFCLLKVNILIFIKTKEFSEIMFLHYPPLNQFLDPTSLYKVVVLIK